MHERRALENGVGAHRKLLGPRVRMVVTPDEDAMHQQLAVLDLALPHTVMPRADTTPTSVPASASSCGPNDTSSICEKPVSNATFTLPIALGVAIPLCGALIAFFYLHRRHIRKQRAEDANDPHKSLDFGLGNVSRNQRNQKAGPQAKRSNLDMYEKPTGGERQRSMDLDMVSPYLLPPELQSSRESLHSLSRTIHQQEDPYRPVTQFVASDAHSQRSFRPRGDDSSVYTASSGAPSRLQETSTADLLSNAATMSRSGGAGGFVPPPRQNSLPRISESASNVRSHDLSQQIPQSVQPPHPDIQAPPPAVQRSNLSNGLPAKPHPSSQRGLSVDSSSQGGRDSGLGTEGPALRSSHNYLGAFINAQDPASVVAPPRPSRSPSHSILNDDESTSEQIHRMPPSGSGWGSSSINSRPQRKESLIADQPPQLPQLPEPQQGWIDDDGSDYGDVYEVTPPSPDYGPAPTQRYSMDVPPEEYANAGLGAPGVDPRRVSMSFRPLPPEAAVESDDPEIRANRIRSFYKEYFDDSKPPPQGQYYEDYDQNYLGDATYYDPNSNNFVMPYAQPVTRRAMTPPPQSQRFMGQPPRAFHGSVGGYGSRVMMPPPPRANSSLSGRMPGSGPRSYSSASGQLGPPGPRKPMPPPMALNTLPTPSKLRDDSFALMNSIDFAPPVSYKERQRGRSQSPMGERRPYSPAVPVFKPLVSTYDELPSMPSPHLLRKSGTFTALDFAPPRRIKDADTMSDAGSIRSNRSGVSAIQQNAIRNGAYRVSRLPGDMIFSKDEMASALKPTWKLGT